MSVVNRAWVVLAVAVGGALATMVRYELALAEPVGTGRFPWVTFTVNIAGSFVLGFAATALVATSTGELWRPSRLARPFIAVGFCGGLTTFSTWMVESVLLVRDDRAGLAVAYLVVSLAAGLFAVAVGAVIARGGFHRPIPAFDPRSDD